MNKHSEYMKKYTKSVKWKKYLKAYKKKYWQTEKFKKQRNKYQSEYREKNGYPDTKSSSARKNYLKSAFGITVEKYDQMLNKQNKSCAICKKHQSKEKRRLAVDHSHKTGKVRGLLCFGCNSSLGKLKDSPALLRRAIRYLTEEHK